MRRESLVEDFKRTLSSGTEVQKLDMLSRLTDLFLASADKFSPEQINLFDELLSSFVTTVDTKTRAKLADQLANVPKAPAGVIRKLAFDDAIEVARPVLRESTAIEEADLVTNAYTKSQQHLLAISDRKALSESVTDVLVTRGAPEVARAVASNANARLSFAGFRTLVRRAAKDDDLTLRVGSRDDVPRQHMLRLLDAASKKVRAHLLAQDRTTKVTVPDKTAPAEAPAPNAPAAISFSYETARPEVEAMRKGGRLNEAAIIAFAQQRKIEHAIVGIALLCDVNIDVVERAMLASTAEILVVLAKVAGLSWTAAKALLRLKPGDSGVSGAALDDAFKNFSQISNVSTARSILSFYGAKAS